MTENTDTTAGPAYVPPLPPPPRPALRRSRSDRVLGGVAGGFAQWLRIDPVIVRVVLVVLAVFGGSGLVLYAVGWLFIPEEGSTETEADRFIAKGRTPGSTTRTVLIAIVAVLAAAAFLQLLAAGPLQVWGITGGGSLLLLALVGGAVLWILNRDRTPASAAPATMAPPPPSAAAAPSDSASMDSPTAVESRDTLVAPYAVASAVATPTATGYAYGGYGDYPGYQAPVPTPVPPRPPKARSYLGLATLSVSLLTMGVLGSLSLSGVATIPLVVILSAGLGVLGLGLLVGTLFGRAKWLMSLAIPLLLVVAIVAVVPTNLRLPKTITVGDRLWSPTTVQTVAPSYSLTIGDAVLDLSQLTLPATGNVPIKANVGIGQLRVKVPAGMRVLVSATTGLGEVRIYGLPARNGQNVTMTTELPGVTSSTGPTVDLTAEVGVGSLEVSRA